MRFRTSTLLGAITISQLLTVSTATTCDLETGTTPADTPIPPTDCSLTFNTAYRGTLSTAGEILIPDGNYFAFYQLSTGSFAPSSPYTSLDLSSFLFACGAKPAPITAALPPALLPGLPVQTGGTGVLPRQCDVVFTASFANGSSAVKSYSYVPDGNVNVAGVVGLSATVQKPKIVTFSGWTNVVSVGVVATSPPAGTALVLGAGFVLDDIVFMGH